MRQHNVIKIKKRLGWLKRWFYQPITDIDLQIAPCSDYHISDKVDQLDYQSIKPNQSWGEPWEYFWFKGQFNIESQMLSLLEKDQRVLLQIETGGESIVYLDKQPIGAIDKQHKEIILRGYLAP